MMMNSGAKLDEDITPYSFDEHYAQYINAAESITDESSSIKLHVNEASSIEVPMGWNRILDNGAVVYISPNKSRLRSMDDVRQYVMSPSTCKCGLECPLHLEKVFSFSTSIPTQQVLHKLSNPHPACHECKVEDGFQNLLLHFTSEKLARLVRKGSKKKRKRPKSNEKEGKKKPHHIRKGQKPNSIVTEPWMKPVVIKDGSSAPYSSSNSTIMENQMGGFAQYSMTNSYSKHHIGSYSQNSQNLQNIDLIDHLTSTETVAQSSINGDLLSAQKDTRDKSRDGSLASIPPADNLKLAALKSAGKRGLPKSKRIPKSKEDITIASMMGRVKQQVGDLDRVRTSQMFTQPHQSVSRQDVRSTSVGDRKTTAHTQNNALASTTTTTIIQSSDYTKSPAVMSLIETKGPPNITLPMTHSNMLPKVVAKGLEYPITSSMQNSAQTPAVSQNPVSQLESQQLAMRHDSHLFSTKASTNVYWGRDEQLASNDVLQPPGMTQSGSSITRTGIPSELSNKSPLVITENNPKSDALRANINENSISANTNNIASKSTDASHFIFKNSHLPKQTLPSEAVSKSSLYPIDKSMITDFSVAKKGAQIRAGTGVEESGVVVRPDIKSLSTDALSAGPTLVKSDSLLAASFSTTASKSPKGITMTPPGSIKESVSSKPLHIQGAETVASTPPSTASQPQQPDFVSFQNMYGISNAANILKGAAAGSKSGNPAANPARFLIMGSQASQALQHLALQQSNTLQVSLQRTENSQAMYLQTLASYNPTSLHPSHGNIGFAYANVPIQLMALGGPQVVGKQQQAQAFNVDRYSNFYRYYQGARQFEGATNDHSSQVQATSLMFPGVNPSNQATGSYIRIAPASPASGKIPLPLPVLATQSQSTQSVLEEVHQQQLLSSSSTQTTMNPSPSNSIPNTNPPISSGNKETPQASSSELKEKPVGTAEGSKVKGKQPSEGSVSPQHSVSPSSAAPPQFGNVLPAKTSHAQVRTQNKTLQHSEINSMPQTVHQSSSVGASTASVEDREALQSIATREDRVRQPGGEVKTSGTLQSPVGGTDMITSQCNRGLNSTPTVGSVRNDDQEELNLKCNEPCNNTSDHSRTPTPEMSMKAPGKSASQHESGVSIAQNSTELKVGDLIWGHQKGYSAWPGKIVSALEVKENSTENGKVWIQWFGEHTHSQMELSSLKSLEEGLVEYRNSKRRKNRSNKKTIESLESAIAEALSIANTRQMTSVSPSIMSELEIEAKKPRI